MDSNCPGTDASVAIPPGRVGQVRSACWRPGNGTGTSRSSARTGGQKRDLCVWSLFKTAKLGRVRTQENPARFPFSQESPRSIPTQFPSGRMIGTKHGSHRRSASKGRRVDFGDCGPPQPIPLGLLGVGPGVDSELPDDLGTCSPGAGAPAGSLAQSIVECLGVGSILKRLLRFDFALVADYIGARSR